MESASIWKPFCVTQKSGIISASRVSWNELASWAAKGTSTPNRGKGRKSSSRCRWVTRRREGMEKIKVLIADDHRVVREGLAAILKTKEDIHVIGEAQDGTEAVEKARALLPEIGRASCR